MSGTAGGGLLAIHPVRPDFAFLIYGSWFLQCVVLLFVPESAKFSEFWKSV
jgi:hypothetical protein